MRIVCFIGLTIKPNEARRHLDAQYFGPASAGDIPAVIAEYQPDAIGLVDGMFHTRPAVLHKDILHALSRGVTVFGAASMGALRAAEMHEYGMVGVGEIYQRLRSGELTGDDEVAIPCINLPGCGWGPAPGMEALVNIRATIDEAVRQGIIDSETRSVIVARAKSLSFLERGWDLILQPAAYEVEAIRAGVNQVKRLLTELRIDLKQRDAIEMLDVMANWVSSEPPPLHRPNAPEGPFWDAALFSRPLGLTPLGDSHEAELSDVALVQDVLDYAIVADPKAGALIQDALIRTLLCELALTLGVTAEQGEAEVAARHIASDLRSSPSNAPFDAQEIDLFGEEEAVCEALHTQYCQNLDRGLLLTLLAEGRFTRIAEVVRAGFADRGLRRRKPPTAENARSIVVAHLAKEGVGDASDHFDRYLGWLPPHRLRSAAVLLTAIDEIPSGGTDEVRASASVPKSTCVFR